MTLSISLITPTYNSVRYLETTLNSVLAQNYPALEYIVMDGNSNDGTQELIHRYESQLAYWQSEQDKGMYEALQKGFARSTGEIMGYLNSDDLHLPHTLATVSQIFSDLPQVQWISSIRPLIVNSAGQFVDVAALSGFHRDAFMRGENMLKNRYRLEMIQQESTFWRRNLWERAGGKLDTSLKLAGDFELWAHFYQHAQLVGVRTILSGFRRHGAQLSALQAEGYHAECLQVLAHYKAQPHNILTASLRRLNPFIPKRVKKAASWLGISYKATNAVYDITESKWKLRHDYI
jgi:glycosyltransferase involved in cell wall biosynthesis